VNDDASPGLLQPQFTDFKKDILGHSAEIEFN